MKEYSHGEMIDLTGLTRGAFNNLVANGVLSNIKPAGTGQRRTYSERNLGEVYLARALSEVGFTIPETARVVKRIASESSKLVAQHPDGRFVLLIIDGNPSVDHAGDQMEKHVKWSRSLQVIKIKKDGDDERVEA